jgi:dihydroorotase
MYIKSSQKVFFFLYFLICEYTWQVHGEVTNQEVDIFDREKVFIETVLEPLIQKLPQLKVVMEHITTMDAVKFVESCKEGIVVNYLGVVVFVL